MNRSLLIYYHCPENTNVTFVSCAPKSTQTKWWLIVFCWLFQSLTRCFHLKGLEGEQVNSVAGHSAACRSYYYTGMLLRSAYRQGGGRSGIELRYVLSWDLTSLTNTLTLAFHCLSKSSMQQIAWGQTVEYYDGVDASVVRAQFGNLPHSGTHSHHPLALSLSVDGCPPNWKVGVCVWMCLLRNPIAKIYRDSCIINWII